jgi:hypothetical protein
LCVFFGMAILWWSVSFSNYRRRVIERRFIEREFSMEEGRIVVRQPLKTDLDPPPIDERSAFGRIYYGVGPYLFWCIPMAYPLQHAASGMAGSAGVFLLLGLLAWPLTVYIFGRSLCGAYLWIYRVWRMQRQYGRPVVFAETES